MIILRNLIICHLLAIYLVTVAIAEPITISIDKIQTNKEISGYVTGIQKNKHSNYKVIVYVHTDRWYIHPYAGQGEGLSWVTINANNTWNIKTVQREFKADQVAALLVKKNYPEPNTLISLERIPSKAEDVKNLQGTEDYGKL